LEYRASRAPHLGRGGIGIIAGWVPATLIYLPALFVADLIGATQLVAAGVAALWGGGWMEYILGHRAGSGDYERTGSDEEIRGYVMRTDSIDAYNLAELARAESRADGIRRAGEAVRSTKEKAKSTRSEALIARKPRNAKLTAENTELKKKLAPKRT
jgi:hypothetical protein